MSAVSVIPANMRTSGRIEVAGDLVLEGSAAGAIEVSGRLILAANSYCEASIRADSAEIAGHLVGAAFCRHAIVVAAGAHIFGDLRAPSIDIHPTAQVLGRVERAPVHWEPEPIARVPGLPPVPPMPAPQLPTRVRMEVPRSMLYPPAPPPKPAAPTTPGSRPGRYRISTFEPREPIPKVPQLSKPRLRLSKRLVSKSLPRLRIPERQSSEAEA